MKEPVTDFSARNRAIRLWLIGVAALIFALVVVGGATRLTESGLSITEWKPVAGVVPPLNETAWRAEFERYKTIPQYQTLNRGMSLADFKTIFWWEWTHRLLGRLVGVVFLLPLLWFAWKRWIDPPLRNRLAVIFGLGALQGAVGWWMVASGLAERTEVSQYRLATHLTLACLIYAAVVWTIRSLSRGGKVGAPLRLRITAWGLPILVLVQIYLGALVAGLRAGYAYNTWPLIDGQFIPDTASLFFTHPWWRNLFENVLTVQFNHRMTAYALWLVAVWHMIDTVRQGRALLPGAALLAVAVSMQAALGIATLLEVVPLSLGLLHQGMAVVVLTVATVHAAGCYQQTPRFAYARP
jgi:cytochrome c oxidase assembly protein subunit 15